MTNATTVNIRALVSTFLPTDGKVIVNELGFPTDHYAIRGQLRQRGFDPDDHVVVENRDGRTIEEDDVIDAMDAHDDAGVLFMPSVLYRRASYSTWSDSPAPAIGDCSRASTSPARSGPSPTARRSGTSTSRSGAGTST